MHIVICVPGSTLQMARCDQERTRPSTPLLDDNEKAADDVVARKQTNAGPGNTQFEEWLIVHRLCHLGGSAPHHRDTAYSMPQYVGTACRAHNFQVLALPHRTQVLKQSGVSLLFGRADRLYTTFRCLHSFLLESNTEPTAGLHITRTFASSHRGQVFFKRLFTLRRVTGFANGFKRWPCMV